MIDFGVIKSIREKIVNKVKESEYSSCNLSIGRWSPEKLDGPFIHYDIDEIWNNLSSLNNSVGKVCLSISLMDDKSNNTRFLGINDLLKNSLDGSSLALLGEKIGCIKLMGSVRCGKANQTFLKSTHSFEVIVFSQDK